MKSTKVSNSAHHLTSYFFKVQHGTAWGLFVHPKRYSNLPSKLNIRKPGACELNFFFLFKNNSWGNLPKNKAQSRQNEQNILCTEEDCQYATFLLIHLIAVGFIHTLD